VNSQSGQRVDQAAYYGAQRGQDALWALARPVLNVVSIAFVVVAVLAVMVVAAVRRRWMLAIQVAVAIGGANATTQLLKDVLYDRPSLVPGFAYPNSLPSGHTTVAASVAVAMLLVAPRPWRPAAAVAGAIWTVLTGVATLVGQWHRPSDVVAAILVSLAWGAVVCAFTSTRTLDQTSQASAASFWIAAILVLVGIGTSVVAGASLMDLTGREVIGDDGQLSAYAGGVAGVVAVACLAFAALLVLRQETARPARARGMVADGLIHGAAA
jgi:membrane-associated phospholipid phosphatase